MAIIRITNLKLRTIIGIYGWERRKKQTVLINVTLQCNAAKAAKSDDINDALDYKTLSKKIIAAVLPSKFYLLEKLCQMVLDIVLENKQVRQATVRIDKPGALRFAESVSVELAGRR